MKVWAVIEGFPYEGESFSSLMLFPDTEAGKAAAEKQCAYYDRGDYFYGSMDLIEVEE
jgi:hypothetical protein